ncbi:hypothetical protein K470DRAFT_256154 [Piedraia hortae CBS 480.64]|uniref:Mitochondrial transcription factor 1 n=1 Tax=Piedraia hortae CBS 480.64 TaxID=1314780 RepID=A0A6A7C3Y1_9PEZI|nr:hypothetical protein K470DRAFT_256154 [Piedraia hortae CBS 480.64]
MSGSAKHFASSVIDKKYAVTKKLAEAFKIPIKTWDQARVRKGWELGAGVEVVSKKLCDDIIQYLSPSLKEYKGCTIIDVHPGACVWSQQLHEYLKPTRHLLMEPDEHYYKPFIEPLLKKPRSKYRHTKLSGADWFELWNNHRKVYADDKLAPVPALPAGDPKLKEPNKKVLMVANLARYYQVHKRSNYTPFDALFMQEMIESSLFNELIHQGGLVRMLFWVSENSRKSKLFPVGEHWRTATLAQLSVAATINEVAGTASAYNPDAGWNTDKRGHRRIIPSLTAVSLQNIHHSGERLGMQLPKGRKYLDHADLKTTPKEIISPLTSLYTTPTQLQHEISNSQSRLEVLKSTILNLTSLKREAILLKKKTLEKTLVYPQSQWIVHDIATSRSRTLILCIDMSLRIIKLEASYKHLTETHPNEPTLSDLKSSILTLNQSLNNLISTQATHLQNQFSNLISAQLSIFSTPPIQPLDARTYLPIKSNPKEFWPPGEMMLVDVIPKPVELSVPQLSDARNAARVASVLTCAMFLNSRHSVVFALERLAPNASRDLVDKVPSLTDPRVGGRLDPQCVMVRQLTPQMVEDLTKAWIEWPFRPSLVDVELAAQGGSSAGEEGEEEEEEE